MGGGRVNTGLPGSPPSTQAWHRPWEAMGQPEVISIHHRFHDPRIPSPCPRGVARPSHPMGVHTVFRPGPPPRAPTAPHRPPARGLQAIRGTVSSWLPCLFA